MTIAAKYAIRLLSVLLLAAPIIAVPQASSAHTSRNVNLRMTCEARTVPLSTGETIHGEFCYRGRNIPKTVHLLLHGATYNRHYWAMPDMGSLYSYPAAATLTGVATFSIDRLGSGLSSHPADGAALTITSGAAAVHDVVTALRDGSAVGQPMNKVISVGHSLGSAHAVTEAATYKDVDAVILTGFLHDTIEVPPAAFYPAALDPVIANPTLDDDYLTTPPPADGQDVRRDVFYYQPTTDPRMYAVDEAHKDIVTTGQFGELMAQIATPAEQNISNGVDVPVLLVVGERDAIFCGETAVDCSSAATVHAFESPYFAASPSIKSVVIPATGHDLQTHLTAPLTHFAALTWASSIH